VSRTLDFPTERRRTTVENTANTLADYNEHGYCNHGDTRLWFYGTFFVPYTILSSHNAGHLPIRKSERRSGTISDRLATEIYLKHITAGWSSGELRFEIRGGGMNEKIITQRIVKKPTIAIALYWKLRKTRTNSVLNTFYHLAYTCVYIYIYD